MADHDSGYKSLFSHPEMVEDLLRGFVHEEWVQDLDFSTLEKVSGNYVTPPMTTRESDAVWRLRWRGNQEAMERVLAAAIEWLREPGLEELRKSFTDWVLNVLLPSRLSGVRFPETLNLEEVKAMLAESGLSWTDQWLREGMEKGLEKGREEGREDTLAEARGVLLQDLERRFGPLPEGVRQRVEGIASIEDLTRFTLRAGAASSLEALNDR